jgi:hypothetical protein
MSDFSQSEGIFAEPNGIYTKADSSDTAVAVQWKQRLDELNKASKP